MADPITRDEFSAHMRLLEEMRSDLRTDIADLKKVQREDVEDLKQGQRDLSKQLNSAELEITTRQDKTNGRVNGHDAALANMTVLVTDLQKQVDGLAQDGCSNYQRHTAQMKVLADVTSLDDKPAPPRWHAPAKKAGIVSGLLAIGAAVGNSLPGILQAIHQLLDHLAGK